MVVKLIGDATSYQKMIESAQQMTAKLAENLTSVGKQLSLAVTAPLAVLGKKAIRAFSDFDGAIYQSASIIKDVTDNDMKRMREVAVSLGTKGVKGPTELARSFYYLASAGLDVESSIQALPALINFATAGAFDLSTATDLLSGSTAALGLKMGDAVENTRNMVMVGDMLVRASTLAQGSVEEYAKALTNDAAGAMKQLNIETADGIAALAAFGEAGKKGNVGGGTFGRMLRLVTAMADKNSDEFKQLKVEIFDTTGKVRQLADIFGDLERALLALPPQQRIAMMNMLGFKTLTQKSVAPLLGLSEKIREFRKELLKAGGLAAQVTEHQLKSFPAQMKVLRNNIEAVGITIGQILSPAMLFLNKRISELINRWQKLDTISQTIIVAIGAVASAIGPLALAIGLIGPAFIRGFSQVMKFLLPISPVIIGITAAIAILIVTTGSLEAAWVEITTVASTFISTVVTGLSEAFVAVRDFLNESGMLRALLEGVASGALVVAIALAAVYNILNDLIVVTYRWLTEFIENNRELINTIVAVVAAIATMVLAFKVLKVSLMLTMALMTIFRIKQIVSIAVWAAWILAVLAAKVMMITFNVVMAAVIVVTIVFKAALIALVAILSVTKAAALAASIGFSVLNAALAVTNLLLAIAAFAVMVFLLTLVASAAIAVYKTVQQLLQAFAGLRGVIGPIGAVSEMLAGWLVLLNDITSAVMVDMPLAWEMMQAAATIAVEQVKMLFPPMWEFIKSAAIAAWDFITNYMTVAFKKGVNIVKEQLLNLSLDAAFQVSEATGFIVAAWQTNSRKAIADSNAKLDQDAKKLTDTLGKDLTGAVDKFNKEWKDIKKSKGLQEAEDDFEALRDELAAILAESPTKAINQAGNLGAKAGSALGQNFVSSAKTEMARFDAAIAGSAEAITRLQEYANRNKMVYDIRDTQFKPDLTRGDKGIDGDTSADYLKRMLELMEDDAKKKAGLDIGTLGF